MDKASYIERAAELERRLYRVARTMLRAEQDIEDAAQEALIKGFKHCHALREPRYFDTWMTRILINECKRILKRQARLRELPLDAAPEPANAPRPGELRDALMALALKYRLPVELHYIEGYSVAEISSMLTIPQGTVKWRLSEARKLLRRELEVSTDD